MRVIFSDTAWEDYVGSSRTDRHVLEKVNRLIEDARRTPHKGLGKPEPLKGDLGDWWSRRITGAHRLVYRVEGKLGLDQRIEVITCRYHY